MRRIASLLLLLVMAVAARADFAAPDFAYPQTVVGDAEAVLAGKAKGLTRLRAVMEIVTAKSSISKDSLYLMPGFISRQAALAGNADARGLMKLYEARVLNEIYSRSSWQYDQVVAPLRPLPANPSDWSGDQFRTRIKELVDSSIMILAPSMTKPIDKFKEVVTLGEGTTTFYPYLRDFVYQQAVGVVDEREKKNYEEALLAQTTEGSPEWVVWADDMITGWNEKLSLYDKYGSGVVGGYLLYELSTSVPDTRDAQMKIVDYLRKYLAQNKVNMMTEPLRAQLDRLTLSKLVYSVPNIAVPGQTFEVECEYSYIDEVGVAVYRKPVAVRQSYSADDVFIGKFTCKVDKNEVKGKVSIPLRLDTVGTYYICGICDGAERRRNGSQTLIVAPWLPVSVSQGNENVVIAARAGDGTPFAGVKASLWSGRKNREIPVGTTNEDGYVVFKSPSKDLNLAPLMLSSNVGEVFYGYSVQVGTYDRNLSEDWVTGSMMVGRPAYHPGDTVQWNAVVVEKSDKKQSSRLLKDVEVSAIFRNANGTPIDTLVVKTDESGRANGFFAVPEDCLTGQFLIHLVHEKRRIAYGTLMVSDFKPPVFEIDGLAVNREDSVYYLTGRAVRYTGVGLPDADVVAKINYIWDYVSPDDDMANLPGLVGKTGPDGSFRLPIPMKAGQSGCYRCEVTVTSAAAETASGNVAFRVGKPYIISGSVRNGFINVDDSVKLKIFAIDTNLACGKVQARWELCDSDSTSKALASGPCVIDSAGIRVTWSHVPAGNYSLRIEPVDTAMFKSADIGDVTLYSIRRNEIPASVDMLLPDTEISSASGQAEVLIGVGKERTVYTVMFDDNGVPQVEVRKLTPGFHSIDVSLGTSKERIVTFATVGNCKTKVQSVTLSRVQPSRKLTLKGESWRDNVVPGAREEWKIKLTDAFGNGLPGAMVATMYNRSLNALWRLSWASDLGTILAAPFRETVSRTDYWGYQETTLYANGLRKMVASPKIDSPAFQFIDHITELVVAVAYGTAARSSQKDLSNKLMAVKTDAALPMATQAKEMVEYEPMAAENEAADAGAGADEPEEFKFRDGEVLQALWMPDIMVDTAGVATLRFVVPDAIGAWTFRASAWTDDCRAAEMLADLVASKPVMVQPSLPRFLRQGDKARVLATVINNTDSAQTITTTVEIFDVVSGAVIGRHDETLALGANGQGLVGIDIEAPVDASMIGYRVKSSTGDFADGEQSMIPVLEATTMAIDSEVFYLNDAEPTFSMTIPADAKGNDIVAVQYCQNPVWDVVKALPGLYDFEPKTACAAAASVYAALTAKNLLKKFPEIREVLKIWQSSPADSALVSKLDKNEDLKLALLAQTPFVGAANANSAQMQRLATTFNEKDIEQVLKVSLSVLEKLQLADGGFAWGRWSDQSSVWVTMSVLTTLGQLNEGGAMPEDGRLDAIVNRGLAYLDKDVEGTVDYSYTRLYSLFPGHKPSSVKGQRSIDKTVQEIVADWKKMPTATKSRDALILNAFGNKAVASEIMESVAQFAVTDGKRGVSFPSVRSVDSYCSLLHSFALINPQSSLIDGMRQWLVLQTQTTDDLGAWNPTALVSAILSTGARWTSLPAGATASMTIDGQPLEVDKVEAATGAFSERIPSSPKKRTITFTRPAGGQTAYGSVLTIGKRPMSEVKARASEQLSVTKCFLVERDGKWVETDRFVLGERVRVQLMVKASDNMEYVTIDDQRPAAFEPVDQIPGWMSVAALRAYRENSDTKTRLFINWLPKGTYYLTYDMTAAYTGSFASGAATIQSQYAPEMTARSGANTITVTTGK